MEIKKEFNLNKIILLTLFDGKYSSTILDIIKNLQGKNICYITLNKTFDALKELFQKRRIEISNIVFVDAISKVIEERPTQTMNCYFLNSPDSLEDLFKMVKKFLRHKFDYIIFDSITNLLVYKEEEIVNKFVRDLITNIRKTKTNGIICVTNTPEKSKREKELIKLTSNLVDKTVDASRKI